VVKNIHNLKKAVGRKRQQSNLPTFDELLIPTVEALISLGGSGTIEEINSKVYEIADVSEQVLQIPHGEDGVLTK